MKDSLLLLEIDNGKTIVDKYSSLVRPAASVTKVFYALEWARRMMGGDMEDELVEVSSEDVVDEEGTNVLRNVLQDGGKLSLRASVLIGLMLKYSCNGSTIVLFKKYFADVEKTTKVAKEVWGMKDVMLVGKKGEWLNMMSLRDISSLYRELYGENSIEKYGEFGELVKKSLKESRNIYYLFDQLELKVLGSKTGTGVDGDDYVVNDSGVVEIDGKKYFWGAMVRRKRISDGVKKIRDYGGMYMDRLS